MLGELTRRARRAYAKLYLWAADRLYNEFAPLYDTVSWLVSSGQWARWRRVALDYVQEPDVLEVGFGTGELLTEMAAYGWNVTGVDQSAAMQRVSSRKVREAAASRPYCIRGRVQTLPLRDACCDTVVSTFPAPYIVEAASLSEIARVLRPGGRLVVVGLVIYTERRKPEMLFDLTIPPEPGVDTFCGRAEDAGLRVRRSSRFMPPARLPVLLAERPA
jgi:ubiquinone/menaquinone biosynthesis C-methylase UbiE